MKCRFYNLLYKKQNPNKLNPLGSKMKWLAQNGVEVKKEQDYRLIWTQSLG